MLIPALSKEGQYVAVISVITGEVVCNTLALHGLCVAFL
jgi:hypothetical protein